MANYRKIYEQYYGIKIPKGYHIHHKDMNHHNDDPLNLEMLTAGNHAQKHGFLDNFIMAQSTACERGGAAKKTPEARMRASVALKKYFENPEARAKTAAATRKHYENTEARAKTGNAISRSFRVTFPNGNQKMVRNLRKFCVDHNLDPCNMSSVSKGRRKQHKGFKVQRMPL